MGKDYKIKRIFDIHFSGLKLGLHEYEFEINKKFFEFFKLNDFLDGELNFTILLEKRTNLLILSFLHKGWLSCPCDRCGDELKLRLTGTEDSKIFVKFGEAYSDNGDEVLVLEEGAHNINVADYCYEFLHLSIPQKKVHLIEDCNQEVLKILNQNNKENNQTAIDPRWSALNKLKSQ